jgi:hypothetical protein
MTVDCKNSTLALPRMTALSSSEFNLFHRYSTGRRCSEPMLVGMLWTEQQSVPRRKSQVVSSHLRSLAEPRRTIAPATIAMINHADYKPKLILFHQTNEMVLRDGLGRVCAVILGVPTSSSSTAPQQFRIYGVTPIIPKQSKAQIFGHTSSTISLINDEVKNRALYEWAVLEATPCRSLFKRRVKLRLDFTADSTFSSKQKINTIKKYAHCGTKASAMLRDQKHRHSTTMILDHKVLSPSTPLRSKRGGPNEIAIAPGMDPYACVFFLACAEEFIACILP